MEWIGLVIAVAFLVLIGIAFYRVVIKRRIRHLIMSHLEKTMA